jgi:hypothetical protein
MSFSSNFTSVAKTGRFNVMIEQKCTSFIHLFISIILKNLLNSLSFARSLKYFETTWKRTANQWPSPVGVNIVLKGFEIASAVLRHHAHP